MLKFSSSLGHPPICGGYVCKDVSSQKKPLGSVFKIMPAKSFGVRLVASPLCVPRVVKCKVVCKATALATEAYAYKGGGTLSQDLKYQVDTGVDRKPGLWPPENRNDNPGLHNPLLRHERMGCGWLAAIFKWEGVLIEDNPDLENQAWLALSEEEGKSPPPAFILKRIEGMKNEQAMSEVLCWSRDPVQLKRMATRKEEIYQALQGGIYSFRPGSQEFVNILLHYKIPMALVSTRPRKTLDKAMVIIGIQENFNVVVTAEDVYRGKPDPEMFMYAAQLLQYIPERCIVFGNSNQTVEAAHDARMKCVAVASKHPMYELSAADLVVKRLDDLSVVDLKNLADIESAEFGEPELEMELEEEAAPHPSVDVDDSFW